MIMPSGSRAHSKESRSWATPTSKFGQFPRSRNRANLRCRRAVEVNAWVPRAPRLHVGVLVHGAVVDDDMDREVFRHAAHRLLEKQEEVFLAILRGTSLFSGPGRDTQRGKQRRRAIALVVVRHRAGAPFLHGQTRLHGIQRLYVTLLIERKAHCLIVA